MKTKIIKPSDILKDRDAVNIKGGVSNKSMGDPTKCTCDCFIGNSNTENPGKG